MLSIMQEKESGWLVIFPGSGYGLSEEPPRNRTGAADFHHVPLRGLGGHKYIILKICGPLVKDKSRGQRLFKGGLGRRLCRCGGYQFFSWPGGRFRTFFHGFSKAGPHELLKSSTRLGMLASVLAYLHVDPRLIGSFFTDNIVFHM
jgi:hypothetical protein